MTLVERLRAVAAMDIRVSFLAHTMDTAKEAADEIERLNKVVIQQQLELGNALVLLGRAYNSDNN